MTTIATRRLLLRPFDPADEDAVLSYRNDPLVARFQGWPLPFTVGLFRELADSARPLGEGRWVSRVICDAGGVCGDIGLRTHDQQAEVGISLASSAQGQGYASEALAALTEYAFATLALHRLHAGIDPANERVARLFTRAGWRDEGTAIESYWHRGVWADETTYALLEREWRARSGS